MRRISELTGCRLPFDNWAPSSLPICYKENMTKYWDFAYRLLLQSELRNVINETGCLVPCIYREYMLDRKPLREHINKDLYD